MTDKTPRTPTTTEFTLALQWRLIEHTYETIGNVFSRMQRHPLPTFKKAIEQGKKSGCRIQTTSYEHYQTAYKTVETFIRHVVPKLQHRYPFETNQLKEFGTKECKNFSDALNTIDLTDNNSIQSKKALETIVKSYTEEKAAERVTVLFNDIIPVIEKGLRNPRQIVRVLSTFSSQYEKQILFYAQQCKLAVGGHTFKDKKTNAKYHKKFNLKSNDNQHRPSKIYEQNITKAQLMIYVGPTPIPSQYVIAQKIAEQQKKAFIINPKNSDPIRCGIKPSYGHNLTVFIMGPGDKTLPAQSFIKTLLSYSL